MRSICGEQLFCCLRAHQHSSNQIKILKDQRVFIYIYIYIYIQIYIQMFDRNLNRLLKLTKA